jgi:hypothetical protein
MRGPMIVDATVHSTGKLGHHLTRNIIEQKCTLALQLVRFLAVFYVLN